MTIQLNGETRRIDTALTMAQLLGTLGLQPQRVAVEVNRKLLPRREFDSAQIREGDQIEIVTLVGGG